ncbi:MAG: hypothetical protein AAFP93_01365 [Bacteroidota bacterium]
MEKHRGEIVEEIFRKSGYSLSRLAKDMMISRNTVYNRFKDPNLSLDFIQELGDIIRYDFAQVFPEIEKDPAEEKQRYVRRQVADFLALEGKHVRLMERYDSLMSFLLQLSNKNDLNTLRQEILEFLEENRKEIKFLGAR